MHSALALLVVASLSADGWETLVDPKLGAQVLRPVGWSVEALPNDALVIKPPPPLGASVALVPVSAPEGVSGRALVAAVAARLGGAMTKEAPLAQGHVALVLFTDAATPSTPRTALVAAGAANGKGVVAILSAPSSEWDAARPALAAIATSLKLTAPSAAAGVAPEVATLRFEPFRETKEQAFSGEAPAGWKKELAVSIVPGASPYVRASVMVRSPENLYAFLHYKLASFQEPVEELASSGPGVRAYQPGAEVLEKYLFPAVARRDPKGFSEWKVVRRGGVQALFSHPTGVRFDGEEVEYSYRYKTESYLGHAFVTTYHLPGQASSTWFLYGLHGYESPAGREGAARAAALRLLSSFNFEGRYAPQADLFWTLSRDATLKALSPASMAAPDGPSVIARRAVAASAVENAALGLKDVRAGDKVLPLQVGILPALQGSPELSGGLLGDLGQVP